MDKKFENNLVKFFSLYKIVRYKKGDIILKPNQKNDYISFIKSGYVRVYTLSESKQEISMSFFKPMLYFTSIYAMTGEANRFYFEAITPVEMWSAPKEEFIDYCKKNPEVGTAVMNRVIKLFLNLVENTGKMLAGNSIAKVAMIITGVIDGKADFALTHKMIASLTGLTRETVTLQMLKLEKMKLIDNKNRKVTILNRIGLDKIIGR